MTFSGKWKPGKAKLRFSQKIWLSAQGCWGTRQGKDEGEAAEKGRRQLGTLDPRPGTRRLHVSGLTQPAQLSTLRASRERREEALSSPEAGTATRLSASLATASNEQLMPPADNQQSCAWGGRGVRTSLEPCWQFGVSGCWGPGSRAKCIKHLLQPALGSELCVCQLS